MLYVLTTLDGALLDWAPTPKALKTPPANSAIRALSEWDAPPDAPYVWVAEFRNWALPPEAPPRRLTPLEFATLRFTWEEQVALEMAIEMHPDPRTRAELRLLDKSVTRAQGIDVQDPRTQFSAGKAVDLLVALGVIAEKDRDRRLEEVLAPPAKQ